MILNLGQHAACVETRYPVLTTIFLLHPPTTEKLLGHLQHNRGLSFKWVRDYKQFSPNAGFNAGFNLKDKATMEFSISLIQILASNANFQMKNTDQTVVNLNNLAWRQTYRMPLDRSICFILSARLSAVVLNLIFLIRHKHTNNRQGAVSITAAGLVNHQSRVQYQLGSSKKSGF